MFAESTEQKILYPEFSTKKTECFAKYRANRPGVGSGKPLKLRINSGRKKNLGISRDLIKTDRMVAIQG